jgi:hypothetical protein
MYDIFAKIASTDDKLKTIDEVHDSIHKGNCYCVSLSTTVVAASTTLLYIVTPNTTVRQHFIAQINSSITNPTVYFSNATVAATSSYTALTAYNMNLNSTKATTTIFGTMATSSGFSTYGGIKYEQYLAQMPAYIGTIQSGSAQYEWMLAQNTGYVIGVTCPTTAAVQINVKVYET